LTAFHILTSAVLITC